MFPAAWERLATLVDDESTLSPLIRAKGLCALCLEVTGATGAALRLVGRANGHDRTISTVCGTDPLSMHLGELQFELGEGPATDALDTGCTVLAPDLADDQRWLWFAPAAVNAGAAASFVCPLSLGSRPMAALSLYRGTRGRLTGEQLGDFQLLAHGATSILCSGSVAVSWAVGEGTGFPEEVHQAVGVLMVQLGVDAEHALARLRGHAYMTEQRMSHVAHDIVGHRLWLTSDAA